MLYYNKSINKKSVKMKKYLLLVEDVKIWEEFKKLIEKDINTEIISLIKDKIKMVKKDGK